MQTGASSTAHVRGVRQIAIPVQDTDRAVAFYRDVVGLPLLFTAGPLAFMDCGGVRLMLATPEGGAAPDRHASMLYFDVGDIHAAHAALLRGGARGEGEPHVVARMADHDLWLAAFHDGEGNVMALMSEVPHTEPRPAQV